MRYGHGGSPLAPPPGGGCPAAGIPGGGQGRYGVHLGVPGEPLSSPGPLGWAIPDRACLPRQGQGQSGLGQVDS